MCLSLDLWRVVLEWTQSNLMDRENWRMVGRSWQQVLTDPKFMDRILRLEVQQARRDLLTRISVPPEKFYTLHRLDASTSMSKEEDKKCLWEGSLRGGGSGGGTMRLDWFTGPPKDPGVITCWVQCRGPRHPRGNGLQVSESNTLPLGPWLRRSMDCRTWPEVVRWDLINLSSEASQRPDHRTQLHKLKLQGFDGRERMIFQSVILLRCKISFPEYWHFIFVELNWVDGCPDEKSLIGITNQVMLLGLESSHREGELESSSSSSSSLETVSSASSGLLFEEGGAVTAVSTEVSEELGVLLSFSHDMRQRFRRHGQFMFHDRGDSSLRPLTGMIRHGERKLLWRQPFLSKETFSDQPFLFDLDTGLWCRVSHLHQENGISLRQLWRLIETPAGDHSSWGYQWKMDGCFRELDRQIAPATQFGWIISPASHVELWMLVINERHKLFLRCFNPTDGTMKWSQRVRLRDFFPEDTQFPLEDQAEQELLLLLPCWQDHQTLQLGYLTTRKHNLLIHFH